MLGLRRWLAGVHAQLPLLEAVLDCLILKAWHLDAVCILGEASPYNMHDTCHTSSSDRPQRLRQHGRRLLRVKRQHQSCYHERAPEAEAQLRDLSNMRRGAGNAQRCGTGAEQVRHLQLRPSLCHLPSACWWRAGCLPPPAGDR